MTTLCLPPSACCHSAPYNLCYSSARIRHDNSQKKKGHDKHPNNSPESSSSALQASAQKTRLSKLLPNKLQNKKIKKHFKTYIRLVRVSGQGTQKGFRQKTKSILTADMNSALARKAVENDPSIKPPPRGQQENKLSILFGTRKNY